MPSFLVFMTLLGSAGAAFNRADLNQQICAAVAKNTCPDNTLNHEEYMDYVVTGEEFIHIYSIEKNIGSDSYLKSYSKFLTETSSVHIAYNENTLVCDTITSDNVTISNRTENMTGACCKDQNGEPLVDDYVILEDESISLYYRFFSQAPARYFWTLFCITGSPETWDDCPSAALDLFMPGDQHIYSATGELDLTGLPLAEIAEDCWRFTGVAMEDVKFIWKGPKKIRLDISCESSA